MATYLGIDYGTKKIGLAWADELGYLFPLERYRELNLMIAGMNLNGWSKREKSMSLWLVIQFIWNGEIGKRAKEVDVFIGKLESRFNLSVHRVDERLTSVAAEETLSKNQKTKKAKQMVG